MRSESYRLRDLDKVTIPIGFVGENLYTTVKIDCGEVFSVHPDAVPSLAVTPPEGESYPAVVTREGDIVIWRVSASDLIHKGTGEIQLSFTIDGEIIGKTYPANTRVFRSIAPSGSVPLPIENWLVQAGEALQALPQEVQDAVTTVLSAMVGIGETLDPDENVTVSYDAENNTLTIGVPKGKDADPAELIDDTSTAQNRTWSAEKLNEEIGGKADNANPEFTGAVSLGRKANTGNGGTSVALGYNVEASAGYAVALGYQTKATEYYANAEGFMTTASGSGSHAEGHSTIASGTDSHSEGCSTKATSAYSHAEGYYTEAGSQYQHVSGKYNVVDSSGTYAEIIGNGLNSNNKSNARTLDWNGNEYLNGDLYVGCNADSTGGTKVAKITDIPDISGKIDATEKGSANGVATLGGDGKVPSAQLPSYVDDVVEYATLSTFPVTGESGKIYVALDTNKTYRWSGSAYVEISASLALGETDATAYRGDRGKIAYDHAVLKGSAFASGFYKITTNAEGHVTAVSAVEKNDITALGICGEEVATTAETQEIIDAWEVSA